MSLPIKKGDWVAEKDTRNPNFGIVKDVHEDQFGHAIDIIMHTWSGERVGRVSPPEGGPASFEPCCLTKNYARIEKPEFPLKRDFTGNYVDSLTFL